MQTETQQTNNQNSVRKLTITLNYTIIAIQWIVLILMMWRMTPISIGWKIADWSFDRQIKTLTLDDQNDPWFIVEKSLRNREYELHHLTNAGVDSWKLPPITFEEVTFASVAVGADGNPWLILGKRLAHWDGSEWMISPMPLDAEINDYSCPSVAFKGSTVWGIDSASEMTRIIQLDLSQTPVDASATSLPNSLDASQYDFDCILSTKNGIIAAISSKDQVEFYELQNEVWQKITSFGKDQVSKIYMKDIALDSAGQIWVLFRLRAEEHQVGKYDPQTNKWTWLDVKRKEEFNSYQYDYGHIAVDNFGRVWISAVQFQQGGKLFFSGNVVADTIGVFEEEGAGLSETIRYTSRNSSLQTSRVARIIVGQDGKVWTWSEQLVWLDGGQESLPTPLPNWLAKLSSTDGLVILIALSVVLLIVLIAVQIKYRFRKTS